MVLSYTMCYYGVGMNETDPLYPGYPICVCNPGWAHDFLQYHDLNCAFPADTVLGYIIAASVVHAAALLWLANLGLSYTSLAREIVISAVPVEISSFAMIVAIVVQNGHMEAASILLGINLMCWSACTFNVMRIVFLRWYDSHDEGDSPVPKMKRVSMIHALLAIMMSIGMAVSSSIAPFHTMYYNGFLYGLFISTGIACVAYDRILGYALHALPPEYHNAMTRELRRDIFAQMFTVIPGFLVVPFVHVGLGSLPFNGVVVCAISLLNMLVLPMNVSFHIKKHRAWLEGGGGKVIPGEDAGIAAVVPAA